MLLMAGYGVLMPAQAADAAVPVRRILADQGRLYDSATGRTFTPRGANYVRLAQTSEGIVYHSSFEPGRYDAGAVSAFLAQLQHDGYNTVRVFIDHGYGTPAHGIGRGPGTADPVYGPYMDNVAAFVREAASRGIYVIPSLDYFPQNDHYWGVVGRAGGPTANVDGQNRYYMDGGWVAAKVEYMKQFAAALLARVGGENAGAVLAYQSDNEVFFESSKAPFDKLFGTATPHNGLTYDMSKPADRQQAADASLVEYSHKIKRGLLQGDQNALMTMGFFTNLAVGKAGFDGLMTSYCSTNCRPDVDYRVPGRASAVSIYGVAEVLDVHVYPRGGGGTQLADDLRSIETNAFRRPYIVGEIGAFKPYFNNDIRVAAYAMRDAQIATCRAGAKGWLYFAWDTYERLAQLEFYFQLAESHGAINGQLAPIVRPDPCQ
jgi:hypothetical protein